MNRIWAAVFLYSLASAPALAAYTPLYAGIQLDNTSISPMLGYRINKEYAAEAHYTRTTINTSQAGIKADTTIDAIGLAALYMFPAKLNGGSSYFMFLKAGFERASKQETIVVPVTITFTLPFIASVKNDENHIIVGVGAQYDFYSSLSGRAGIDIVGDRRSIYLSAILKF